MIEILSAVRICKNDSAHGLFNVNFQAFAGEILGFLVRDEIYLNTLFSILIGAISPDSGKLFLNECEVELTSELISNENGIYWVKKQSQLVPKLTLAENICSIGTIQHKGFFINNKKNVEIAQKLLAQYGQYGMKGVSATCYPYNITQAQCHIVETIKAIFLGAKAIIIDDLFQSYSEREFETFLALCEKITQNDIAILIFSSQWNNALIKGATRLNIISHGTISGHISDPNKINVKKIAQLFDIDLHKQQKSLSKLTAHPSMQEDVLSLSHISDGQYLKEISFSIRKGHITGIFDADVGKSLALAEVLNGQRRSSGSITFNNQKRELENSFFTHSKEIIMIPDCAIKSMVFDNMDLVDNIALMIPKDLCFPHGLENRRMKKYIVECALEAIQSKELLTTLGDRQYLSFLDKHTQLKILVARLICSQAKLAVIINPQHIYYLQIFKELNEVLQNACSAGLSILVISHSYSLLTEICSDIMSLENGIIIEL